MLRIGIVDCDTSHVVQFTMRLNHVEIDQEQWVDGANVVAAVPLPSAILEQAKIDEYVEKLRGWGVEIVEKPEDLLEMGLDGVCIEAVDGSVHLERARPFLEAGMPLYIDKPFTTSSADAKEILRLARENNVPVFSTSSLRFGLEVVEVLEDAEGKYGKVIGANCWSPASLHDRNPGLFHYGIHAVEPLFTLMGAGCDYVHTIWQDGAEVTVGVWDDGRIGTVRGTRAGAHAYGFTAWCEKQVVTTSINAGMIYRELLKKMVEMFQTGVPPVDLQETLELVAFIEAAMESQAKDGAKVKLNR
ncbi:MAG: Gfo/Idh/MocA family oxidoreductase [Acidobacteriota bacterium]|nr:Gfo/Idh/MocA family oxidoreductase [Acidobacteriota bacterium]